MSARRQQPPPGSGGRIAQLAATLVRAESVNPGLAPDGSGEAAVGDAVAGWARAAGLEVEVDEVLPGRSNVLVTAPGTGAGRTLMLNGHLDTVGVAGMERPFAGEIRDGRVYGRGSYDMKGALAAALVASALALDEELASAGTEGLLASRTADAAIVCEPTDERIGVAHKGFAGFEIETKGRAAHGSRPDLGVDAIAAMGPVLTRLGTLAASLARESGHPLLGTGSIHASLIEGGQEYSSYPARCLLTGERRTLPGETDADLERELLRLAHDADAVVKVGFARDPFEIDPGHELPDVLAQLTGSDRFHGLPFWTDASLLSGAGVPTIVYGPCGGGAHAIEEWVEIESLERCARVYLEVARVLCA